MADSTGKPSTRLASLGRRKRIVLLVVALVAAASVGFVVGRATVPPPATPTFLGVSASLYAKLLEAAAQRAGVPANFLAEGSLAGARQIALNPGTYSLFASVDPAVIEAVLYPNDASWYIALARDRMVLGYSSQSSSAPQLANWSHAIAADLAAGNSAGALNLTRVVLDHVFSGNATLGTSDPNTDPEGYRVLMELQLAGLLFYGDARHYTDLLAAAQQAGHVVTVSAGSQLFSYVQSGQVEYDLALYRSAALGASIAFVPLAPQVDLGDVNESAFYARSEVNVTSSSGTITLHGAPIVLAATIPMRAPDAADAVRIILYLLSSDGQALMAKDGIGSLSPGRFYGNTTALDPTLKDVLGSSLLQSGA